MPFAVGTNVLNKQLTGISSRYRPWGNTSGINANMAQVSANELEFTDPQITQSSAWQFSTNKYPNVGWLGRVHRGTPWQTVYLKSHGLGYNANTFPTAWQYWTGNPNPVDAVNAQPISDWQLLDLFTTAPNDNASRGQLSVNQPNSAAWAAVLDGVMTLANNMTPGVLVPTNIDTTQANGPGQFIISSINQYRALLPNQVFTSVGQILAVTNLTVTSPYLNANAPNDTNVTDAVYERIPQQILSLLRVGTPRYAIFAYGQALKPADHSIVQSGQFFGMPTNYQITGEVMTRTIVRFDNMPVPGVLPGTGYTYDLPVQGQSSPSYVVVSNYVPPMRAVTESFSILGPDQ